MTGGLCVSHPVELISGLDHQEHFLGKIHPKNIRNESWRLVRRHTKIKMFCSWNDRVAPNSWVPVDINFWTRFLKLWGVLCAGDHPWTPENCFKACRFWLCSSGWDWDSEDGYVEHLIQWKQTLCIQEIWDVCSHITNPENALFIFWMGENELDFQCVGKRNVETLSIRHEGHEAFRSVFDMVNLKRSSKHAKNTAMESVGEVFVKESYSKYPNTIQSWGPGYFLGTLLSWEQTPQISRLRFWQMQTHVHSKPLVWAKGTWVDFSER